MNTKFKYGQFVRIISKDFYEGCCGYVEDYHPINVGLADETASYKIRLEYRREFLNRLENELEIV